MDIFQLPDPPQFSKEELKKCQNSGEYRPILFEWYKYVGIVCHTIASIKQESPSMKNISELDYAILIGLLNRCSNLIYANTVLSKESYFGETTAIIDRCIFESTVKIIWLCNNSREDRFKRYILDGLKVELVFKNKINDIISERQSKPLIIENRMLRSIENYIVISGVQENEIIKSKSLPSLASMIEDIGQDKLLYVVGQKIGSHHVHGTWPSLILHYLDRENEQFTVRHSKCETNANQYVFIPIFVLCSLRKFIKHVILKDDISKIFIDLFDSIEEEIRKLNIEMIGEDFKEIDVS